MIQTYGQGQPGDVVRPIFHHAQGIRDVALAVLAGLWAHELHTDPTRVHQLHFGKGANGINLYLDNGERFAFRGQLSNGGYDHIRVHQGGVRPLGPVAIQLYAPADTGALWKLLSAALSCNAMAA
jgi:hypothetical protein